MLDQLWIPVSVGVLTEITIYQTVKNTLLNSFYNITDSFSFSFFKLIWVFKLHPSNPEKGRFSLLVHRLNNFECDNNLYTLEVDIWVRGCACISN